MESHKIAAQRALRQRALIQKFKKIKVLVVGDVMLDTYIRGSAERLSPEALVPVLLFEEEEHAPGGAANVARSVSSLGGKATLVGVCGSDPSGTALRQLVRKNGIAGRFLLDSSRPTTQKKRLVVRGYHQLARLDYEDTSPLSPAHERTLLALVRSCASSHDVMILSDYAKGIFSPRVIAVCVQIGRRVGIPVLLDPKPSDPSYLRATRGVTLITPNLSEADVLVGKKSLATQAKKIAKSTGGNVLITLGAGGMVFAAQKEKILRLRALAQFVVDVSGAGDTVQAAFALALAAGASAKDAADLANRAASIVVGKPGTATLSAVELHAAL